MSEKLKIIRLNKKKKMSSEVSINLLNVINNEEVTSGISFIDRPELTNKKSYDLKSDRYSALPKNHSVLKAVDLKRSISLEENDEPFREINKTPSNESLNSLLSSNGKFKIELQKDLVNMLDVMRKEYIKRLGAANEFTFKAIDAYFEAKKLLDEYEKSC